MGLLIYALGKVSKLWGVFDRTLTAVPSAMSPNPLLSVTVYHLLPKM